MVLWQEKRLHMFDGKSLLIFFLLNLVYRQLHSILEKLIAHPDEKIDIEKTRFVKTQNMSFLHHNKNFFGDISTLFQNHFQNLKKTFYKRAIVLQIHTKKQP